MDVSYHNRYFKSIENTSNGEVSSATLFHYRQEGDMVWATYQGGSILFGTLVAKVLKNNCLDMRYQHWSTDGAFKTGICASTPEVLVDGRIRLHEKWRWTSGDQSEGHSVLEEILLEDVS